MKSTIIDGWLRIRASYWFVPSLMAIAAMAGAVILTQLDGALGTSRLRKFDWLYANRPEGAQALLATIAGSMITVAGVTFSMTLLAVSHATSQIGHGLLTGFMRDRGNQFTLGTFIATFLYCLMVLRTVRTTGGDANSAGAFVPHLAVLGGLALAILSVAVLIYFIHHVPHSINVSSVVARLGDDLVKHVSSLYPQGVGDEQQERGDATERLHELAQGARSVAVQGDGGYLRVIDEDGLLEMASRHDLILRLHLRPGDFAFSGQPLMQAWPESRVNHKIEAELCSIFSWGAERTPEQDVLLSADRLLEILGKALSPGVNNQQTALLCINQLQRGLAAMLARRVPATFRVDADGQLRVIAEPVTHAEFVKAVYRPIRQYVRGDWIATHHVLKSLDALCEIDGVSDNCALIGDIAAQIRDDAQSSDMGADLMKTLEQLPLTALEVRA